jgi:hypothetical protein
MALADLDNQDGPDLIVVEPDLANVAVWLNDGAGDFSEETTADAGDFPVAVVAAEINLDPRLDLVVVNRDSATVSVLLQDADFFFEPLEGFEDGFPVNAAPVGVIVADLDNDRRVDLAVLSDATIRLLKGVGNGAFNDFPTASISTGSGTGGNYAIAAGDFNGDRSIDLAVSSRGTRRLSVLLGNGNGTFQAPRIFGLARAPGNLLVRDFRGDVAFDDIAIVTSDDFEAEVNLFVSDGTGGFTQEITGSAPGEIATLAAEGIALTAGDLDNDGKVDLIVGNPVGAPGVELLCRQPSSVCFQPELPGGLTTNPLPDAEGFQLLISGAALSGLSAAVVSADVNGDRLADILSIDPEGDGINVLLNTTGGPPDPTPTATMGGTLPPPTSNATATVTPTKSLTPTPLPTSTPTLIPTVPYTVCTTNDAGQPSVVGRIVAVATGDFNRDGNVDIVAADNSGNRLVVLLTAIRMGAATACEVLGLSRGAEIPVGAPTSLKANDLDGDGRLDLVVAGSAGISVFYGDGNGGFVASPGNPMLAGGNNGLLALSDVNRDGGLDIIIAHPGVAANGVGVLVRDPENRRVYRPICTIDNIARSPDALLAQDLNRDGRSDFAIVTGQTTDLSVFQQLGAEVTPTTSACPSGTNGFRGLTPFVLPNEPRALVAGNFEQGDAVPDIAVAMRGGSSAASGRLAVVLGRAAGTDVSYQLSRNLLVPAPGTSASLPSSIGSGDVNRDGRSDVIITDESNDTIVVFLAQSDGSFGPNLIPASIFGARPVQLEVADIDGDGVPDLVTANAGRDGEAGGISILVSSRPPNTPTPLPTFSPTLTGTPTETPTETQRPTGTPSATGTITQTPTRTPTERPAPSASPTKTLKPGTINLSDGSCAVSPAPEPQYAALLWLAGAVLALLTLRNWESR